MTPDPESFDGLSASWARSLRARNRSENTIYSYLLSARKLEEFLGPLPVDKVDRGHVEAFLTDQLANWKPNTAAIRYRSLKQFFGWLLEEQEIDTDPMLHVREPEIPETPVPVVKDDPIKAILVACEGRGFPERRDMALLRLFTDTPGRLSEIALVNFDDLDLRENTVKVMGKGRRERTMPFGPSAALALDRYLRARTRHKYANSPALWLGTRGPMTPNGVTFAVKRRARMAGVTVHPHQFRHTFAHDWKLRGLSDTDLMKLGGWRSREVMGKYGSSAAAERALAAYQAAQPGERF